MVWKTYYLEIINIIDGRLENLPFFIQKNDILNYQFGWFLLPNSQVNDIITIGLKGERKYAFYKKRF